ncbi:hypothetical protein SAMN05216249_10752 [Acetitomaculum ruminis DSM 5522]|uniref:Uncharacterized protein n=1 Tax=Acetitomaculum ruminis DSM 5522 TaxID=1120918 RepID=A0A1I0XPS4_9FIRM|nr:hypothetical protein [Acetitomaculum ruminis]SFB02687.1 hypothetical protein SAMN05216249_10752 [Acetitomaculum ruminis DSM 5522]
MDEIVKGFTGLFIIMVAVFMLLSFIGVSFDIETARGFFNEASDEIRDGNYSPKVINECISNAQKKGYELRFTEMKNDEDGIVEGGRLNLSYNIKIGFFKLEKKKTLDAYIG